MMRWDKDGPERVSNRQIVLVFLMLSLAMLACALFEPTARLVSDRTANRGHLPTLTPTTIPTLPAAVAPAEPVVVSPTLPPTPALVPATSDSLAPTNNQDNTAPPLLTALADLNVRAGPGLEYMVMGQLVQGQSTRLTGQSPDGGWWQIIYPPDSGGLGWVSADPQYSITQNAQGLPVSQGPPLLTATPPPTAIPVTPTLAPVIPPTQAPTPTLEASDWAFSGIRLDTEQDESSLIVYGNMINTTGTTQEVAFITGSFHDAGGQVIADESSTYDRWLIEVVPPGGQMPFELTVPGIQDSAHMKLRVEAEPGDETPRQDFEFLDTNSSTEWGDYCLSSVLRNPGDELEEYLIIGVTLYDSQDNVINFNNYEELDFEEIVDDQMLEFEVCVDPLDQAVARYELQAWGL